MSEATRRKPPHAVVFPYPFQGHVTPTIKLAAKLAANGFTVTCVLPEFIHQTLSKHHESYGAAAGVRCADVSDGFPVEFDRDANLTEYWESMIVDFPARVDEAVRGIKECEDPEAELFLVADSLYTWPAEIAAKHKLVNVSLWTATALVFSIGYHLDLLIQNGHFAYQGNNFDQINYIPGVHSINTNNLPSYVQQPHAVPTLDRIFKLSTEQVKKADFILCNTIQELESDCLSSLHLRQPTYAVGPINFSAGACPGTTLRPESDCSKWLESKPPNSVLYISLGSIFEFNEEQIKETAHAILSTRVSFIWVLKNAGGGAYAEILPTGFMDDVRELGLVIPWCNQNLVLSSVAIGGFLTHCGWNSTLESMWSGVPMLCYPCSFDQPTNRKLVVEDWRVGIDLCDGGEVTREEVSRKIEGLMKGESGVELREEVKRVKEIARNALEREGSSQRNFHQFVTDLKGRLSATKEEGPKK